jgi:hypothetical protein
MLPRCVFCSEAITGSRYLASNGYAASTTSQSTKTPGATVWVEKYTTRDFEPLEVPACDACFYARLRSKMLPRAIVSIAIAAAGLVFVAWLGWTSPQTPVQVLVFLALLACAYFLLNLVIYIRPYLRRRPGQKLVDEMLDETAQRLARAMPGKNVFYNMAAYNEMINREQ